jgi:hypothetical protein
LYLNLTRTRTPPKATASATTTTFVEISHHHAPSVLHTPLPIEHSTSTLKRPTNTIAMASPIDQLQGGTTMIFTGENVQLALLKQAKKRNAIAKEQNAIAKERNAIAREQVKATRK